ncbi:conserved hypothetical protein-like protein [Desulfatibacillum aliphaticivorans]|uniref:DUF2062 domain-containing protein n=2 Tax=Desulfatibacillum aliphaticivorans TaxID=218208 RepID=B8FE25_DESAL|nr:conserved hypothetical protein-like protein [Desulfatibacillum aliphaticivorans]
MVGTNFDMTESSTQNPEKKCPAPAGRDPSGREDFSAGEDDCGLSDHDIEQDFYKHYLPESAGLKGILKRAFHRFLAIRGTPRELALGLALGVFVGMSPYMGVHTAVAVLFAAIFKWSKISAAVGVQISNFGTAPFVYWFTYHVGKFFYTARVPFQPPSEFSFNGLMEMLKQTPEMLWILTIGGVVAGIPLAFITYWIAFKAVTKYREDIKEKIAAHKRKLLRKARRKR